MDQYDYESYKFNFLNSNIGNYIKIITYDRSIHEIYIDKVLFCDNITNYHKYTNKPILLYRENFNNKYYSFSIAISDIISIYL